MGDSFFDIFTPQEIEDAKNGDRRAAEKLLKRACMKLQANKPFPPVLRDYFLEAFNLIIDRKKSCDHALHIIRSKESKRADMVDVSREIFIAEEIDRLVNQGMSINKAAGKFAEDSDLEVKQIKNTYKKWREGIKENRCINAENSTEN